MARVTQKLYAGITIGEYLNLQPGQKLAIYGEKVHSPFARLLAEAAKKAGASEVRFFLYDPNEEAELIRGGDRDALQTPPEYLVKLSAMSEVDGFALVKIVGEENPEIFKDLDPELVQLWEKTKKIAMEPLRDKVMRAAINRTNVANATRGWAVQVFPQLAHDPAKARYKLQQLIYRACLLHKPDPVQASANLGDQLEKVRDWLDEQDFTELQFKGPETDLTVALGEQRTWVGAAKVALNGVRHYANAPYGEVFGTPYWPGVNGKVRITMPSLINGVMCDGIWFKFEDGKVVDFGAREGYDSLAGLLSTDEGAKTVGEIALVSGDSPVALLNIIFRAILLDEKARCHLALGIGYAIGLVGGGTMTAEELTEMGVANSHVHHDFMISDENTTVIGKRRDGTTVEIIVNGVWAKNVAA